MASAVVLATGVAGGSSQPSPVIVYQPVGSGRVVVVAGVSESASRVPFVEEMVLDLRGVTSFGADLSEVRGPSHPAM